jgi:hypothetical protein
MTVFTVFREVSVKYLRASHERKIFGIFQPYLIFPSFLKFRILCIAADSLKKILSFCFSLKYIKATCLSLND